MVAQRKTRLYRFPQLHGGLNIFAGLCGQQRYLSQRPGNGPRSYSRCHRHGAASCGFRALCAHHANARSGSQVLDTKALAWQEFSAFLCTCWQSWADAKMLDHSSRAR